MYTQDLTRAWASAREKGKRREHCDLAQNCVIVYVYLPEKVRSASQRTMGALRSGMVHQERAWLS